MALPLIESLKLNELANDLGVLLLQENPELAPGSEALMEEWRRFHDNALIRNRLKNKHTLLLRFRTTIMNLCCRLWTASLERSTT